MEEVDVECEADQSADALQRSLHALLERGGVMHDLRAHLRAQLIALIRHANTGESLICKELMSQRLEPKFQAVNMLIAEYLMRGELRYTLSVFLGEIPLESMVFLFARRLLDSSHKQDYSEMRFAQTDIWRMLYTLGVCCDTKQAQLLINLYETSNAPLLVCLLTALHYSAARDSRNDEGKDEDKGEKEMHGNAFGIPLDHLTGCKVTKHSKKKFQQESPHPLDVEQPGQPSRLDGELHNFVSLEKDLIDEMFNQLRSVYDTETEMSRSRQDARVQREIESHRQLLRRREIELEDEYRRRSEIQEIKLEERKRFLWQLARRLRHQHEELTQGMRKVQTERAHVQQREENLKEQLKSAEELLKRNGEEMRDQLAQELKVLEQHIETMKIERANISIERDQLEKMKMTIPNQSDEVKSQFEEQRRKQLDLQKHYDVLKDELSIVKKFVASSKILETKSVVEQSSITDIYGINSEFFTTRHKESAEFKNAPEGYVNESKSSFGLVENRDAPLNNGRNVDKSQLNNNLKKTKNVNFRNDPVEIVTELQSKPAMTSISTMAAENPPAADSNEKVFHEVLAQLREDNVSLRSLANQQQRHMGQLIDEQSKLRAELACVRRAAEIAAAAASSGATRAAAAPADMRALGMRTAPPSTGWPCKTFDGAGGEMGAISPPQTPAGYTSMRSSRQDAGSRQQVTGSWRKYSPPRGRRTITKPLPAAGRPIYTDSPNESSEARMYEGSQLKENASEPVAVLTDHSFREEVPGARELGACEDTKRDTSPTQEVLAKAKTRLRKLEIEAEVVEQSYLDFRRRHSADVERAQQDASASLAERADCPLIVECRTDQALSKYAESQNFTGFQSEQKDEYKKYMSNYKKQKTRIPIRNIFPNNENVRITRNLDWQNKSEPKSEIQKKNKTNLIEKPLIEFRKLYQSNRNAIPATQLHKALHSLRTNESAHQKKGESPIPTEISHYQRLNQVKSDDNSIKKLTEDQLKMLKNNIRKVYDMDQNLKLQREEILKKIDTISLVNNDYKPDSPKTMHTKTENINNDSTLKIDQYGIGKHNTGDYTLSAKSKFVKLVENAIRLNEKDIENEENIIVEYIMNSETKNIATQNTELINSYELNQQNSMMADAKLSTDTIKPISKSEYLLGNINVNLQDGKLIRQDQELIHQELEGNSGIVSYCNEIKELSISDKNAVTNQDKILNISIADKKDSDTNDHLQIESIHPPHSNNTEPKEIKVKQSPETKNDVFSSYITSDDLIETIPIFTQASAITIQELSECNEINKMDNLEYEDNKQISNKLTTKGIPFEGKQDESTRKEEKCIITSKENSQETEEILVLEDEYSIDKSENQETKDNIDVEDEYSIDRSIKYEESISDSQNSDSESLTPDSIYGDSIWG